MGADDFLSKPFKLNELQSKIYKYIEELHQKREEIEAKSNSGSDESDNIDSSEDRGVEETTPSKDIILSSIESSQQEIFKGLAHILSLKDRGIKVSAKLAKAFAELLNYKRDDIERLYIVTMVYNIGALSQNEFKNSHANILNDKVDNRDIIAILQGYQSIKGVTKTPFMDM